MRENLPEESRRQVALGNSGLRPWHNRPGGLDIEGDPDESLEEFTYLDTPGAKGRGQVAREVATLNLGQL
jgi:hypothetical protein